MGVPVRSEIRLGLRVQIVEKHNQRTGSPSTPPGEMLSKEQIGRVFPAWCLRDWLSGWRLRQAPPASEAFRS
jgi:hypothetical protein